MDHRFWFFRDETFLFCFESFRKTWHVAGFQCSRAHLTLLPASWQFELLSVNSISHTPLSHQSFVGSPSLKNKCFSVRKFSLVSGSRLLVARRASFCALGLSSDCAASLGGLYVLDFQEHNAEGRPLGETPGEKADSFS